MLSFNLYVCLSVRLHVYSSLLVEMGSKFLSVVACFPFCGICVIFESKNVSSVRLSVCLCAGQLHLFVFPERNLFIAIVVEVFEHVQDSYSILFKMDMPSSDRHLQVALDYRLQSIFLWPVRQTDGQTDVRRTYRINHPYMHPTCREVS